MDNIIIMIDQEQDISENALNVNVTRKDADFVRYIKNTLNERLSLTLTESDIVSLIINNYREENNYMSLFRLTKDVQLVMSEVKIIGNMTDKELRVLEYMQNADRRNTRVKTLVGLLKMEMSMGNSLTVVNKSNIIIKELLEELDKDYNARYSNLVLRKGLKKLIIKATLISLTYQTRN